MAGEETAHRACDLIRAERVDEEGGVAGDLRRRGDLRGNHGRSAGHGLQDGEAEAFVQRGEGEQGGAGVQPGQVFVRHVAEEADGPAQAEALDKLFIALVAPGGLAGDDEWHLHTFVSEPGVGADQPLAVLAGLQAADAEQVAGGEAVAQPHPLDGAVIDRPELGGGGLRDGEDALRVDAELSDDVEADGFGWRDDRAGQAGGGACDAFHVEPAADWVALWDQHEGEIMDGDNAREPPRDDGGAVMRRVEEIDIHPTQQRGQSRLLPKEPRPARRRFDVNDLERLRPQVFEEAGPREDGEAVHAVQRGQCAHELVGVDAGARHLGRDGAGIDGDA